MLRKIKDKADDLKSGIEAHKEAQQEKRETFLIENADNLPKIFKATSKFDNIHVDDVSNLFRVINVKYELDHKKKSKVLGTAMFVSTMGMSAVLSAGNSMAKSFKKEGYYRFTDLISFDLIMDDESVSSGGLGRAFVGGALLGGVGAIVGATTGSKKTRKIVNHMAIKLTVNDLDNPLIIIPLITKKTKTKSKEFKIAETEAHKILATLELITKKTESQLSENDLKLLKSADSSSDLDELIKLKELLDMGAINEEEFELKKQEILNIQ